MKIDIVEVDIARGIKRITTADSRWYARHISVDGTAENRSWDYVPSVTWVCDHYPKGRGFWMWLAKHGWSESEEIKAMAGDKGSKVHHAITRLVSGGTVLMGDSFADGDGDMSPLTPAEYECLMSFVEWWNEVKPELIAAEVTVWNEKYRYAGTLDLKVRIGKTVWIIDIKTSPQVWPSFEIQVSAYKHADPSANKNTRLAILQVGYKYNKKKKWKFTPVADQFDLFLAARKIWARETAGVSPLQREYPLELSLSSQKKAEAAAA